MLSAGIEGLNVLLSLGSCAARSHDLSHQAFVVGEQRGAVSGLACDDKLNVNLYLLSTDAQKHPRELKYKDQAEQDSSQR